MKGTVDIQSTHLEIMLRCERKHEVDGLVIDCRTEKITIRIRSLEISKSDKTSLALVQVTGGVTLALEIHLGLQPWGTSARETTS